MEQSFIVPVAGDFAATESLPEQGAGVPVRGPVVRNSLFSSPSASMPGFSSSYIYLIARPFEPMYFSAKSIRSGSVEAFLSVKFTLNILF